MSPAFDVANPDSWPVVMTADEVAAIYRRAVGGLRKSCQERKFVPAPYQVHPFLWRKVDVLRHVEGARGASLRRAV